MTLASIQAVDIPVPAWSTDNDRALIEFAKRDREGFGLLYRRYCPMLLNYVHRRTGNRHVTEDLVADVFLNVMRALPGYRYRGVPLRSWLLRIATNTVNRWAKRQRKRLCTTLDAEALTEASGPSTNTSAEQELLQKVLLSLPPRYQAVLALHHMEGLSVKETAAIIGCREGTVRSRLSRARDALRSLLQERR